MNKILSKYLSLKNEAQINLSRDKKIVKAPFNWSGSKYSSANKILEILPVRTSYVEPFGGSGVILLNRTPSKLEIFNDRFSGIIDFYMCLKNDILYYELIDEIDTMLYSREMFNHCSSTWRVTTDKVERAAKWYWSVVTSFGCMGRNFGRSLTSKGVTKPSTRLKRLLHCHNRLKNVLIENLDWRDIFNDFDSSEAVFFVDPPYLNTNQTGMYDFVMCKDDHEELLDKISKMKAYVAVSTFETGLYDLYKWDKVYSWDKQLNIKSLKNDLRNNKDNYYMRDKVTEYLYIKEAS